MLHIHKLFLTEFICKIPDPFMYKQHFCCLEQLNPALMVLFFSRSPTGLNTERFLLFKATSIKVIKRLPGPFKHDTRLDY